MSLTPDPQPVRVRAREDHAPLRQGPAAQYAVPLAHLLVLVLAAISLLRVTKTTEYGDFVGPGGSRVAASDAPRGPTASPS